MSRAKFKPGPPIRTLPMFVAIAMEERPIYYRHQVVTIGWYQNWSLHLINHNIGKRYLRQALPAQEGLE